MEALSLAAKGTPGHEARLHKAAQAVRNSADLYESAPNGALFKALGELLEQIALLADWRAAVLAAAPDSDRFRKAAKLRAEAWIEANKDALSLSGFQDAAERIKSAQDVSDVARIAGLLGVVPLPVGLFTAPNRSVRTIRDEDVTRDKSEQLTVAFIKFTVDGTPLEETHFLTPGELHDLDIEVRVSRWPQGATGLVIEPITIEQASTYQMPVFSFQAPSGSGPFQLRERGRVHLVVPHHINARPFEFKYVAKFTPHSAEQPVSIVGQRTLVLEGIDLARNPITGYPNLDMKIMEVRDRLRQTPGVLQQELLDALRILAPVVNYAGQVVQDNLYDSVVSEAEFQKRMRTFLRAYPMIGGDLEEHRRAGGGIVDLSFKGIRLELKSVSDKPFTFDDCKKFVGQAASYAAASGKRIALLCVLDCSKKERAAFPVEDGIGILMDQQGSSMTFVITILLQGNLVRPSNLSRKVR